MKKIINNIKELEDFAAEVKQNPPKEGIELELSESWVIIDWAGEYTNTMDPDFLKWITEIRDNGGRIISLKAPHLWGYPQRRLGVALPTLQELTWNEVNSPIIAPMNLSEHFQNLRVVSWGINSRLNYHSYILKNLEGLSNLEEIEIRTIESSKNAQMPCHIADNAVDLLVFLEAAKVFIESHPNIKRFDIKSESFDILIQDESCKAKWEEIQFCVRSHSIPANIAEFKKQLAIVEVESQRCEEFRLASKEHPDRTSIKNKYKKYKEKCKEVVKSYVFVKKALLRDKHQPDSDLLEIAKIIKDKDPVFAFQLLDKLHKSSEHYSESRFIMGHEILNQNLDLPALKEILPELTQCNVDSKEGVAKINKLRTQKKIICLIEAGEREDIKMLLDNLLYEYVRGGMQSPDDASFFMEVPLSGKLEDSFFYALDFLKRELEDSNAKDVHLNQLARNLKETQSAKEQQARQLDEVEWELRQVKDELARVKAQLAQVEQREQQPGNLLLLSPQSQGLNGGNTAAEPSPEIGVTNNQSEALQPQ